MLAPLPQPDRPNPYEVRERRMIYDSPWIRLREDRFDHRRGTPGRYAVCGFLRTACGVLALDDQDRVVLVGQWRYPVEGYSWELPEGGGEPHESPFEAIRRELGEEAGLQARVWEPLLYFNPSNATTDEETFLFLATGLSPSEGHQLDEHEELMLHHEPFEACVQRVFTGEIRDSLTVAALLALAAKRMGAGAAMEASLAERFFQRPAEHPSPGRARWDDLSAEAGK